MPNFQAAGFPVIVNEILRGDRPAIIRAVDERIKSWRQTIGELHSIEERLAAHGLKPDWVHDANLGHNKVMDIVQEGFTAAYGSEHQGIPSIANSPLIYLPAGLPPTAVQDIEKWRQIKEPLMRTLEKFAAAKIHLADGLAGELANIVFEPSYMDNLRNVENNVGLRANEMFNELHAGKHTLVGQTIEDMLWKIQRNGPSGMQINQQRQ